MRRLAVLLLAGTLLAVSLPAGAQDPEQRLTEIEQEIRDLNTRIASAKGGRVDIQNELAQTEARLAEVRAELAVAESRLAEVETSIAEAETRLEELAAQIVQLERKLAEVRASILDSRQLVRERAVELYMQGSGHLTALVLTTADVSDVELGIEYAQEVIADGESLINSLEILRHQEEENQAAVESRRAETLTVLTELEKRRGEVEAYRAEVEAARAEVEAELEKGRRLLVRANTAIAEFEGELTALERESAQIEAELAALQTAGGTNPGVLAWPISGRVGSGFGFRIHPIFGTKKLHTGIDTEAASGTPIRAAGSGTVILARTYGGYGKAVVIDHGGGLSTLYAHQSAMLVSEGQQVERGQVIGYVGCTGYCTGPHLHFETRELGKPVDPMKYLS